MAWRLDVFSLTRRASFTTSPTSSAEREREAEAVKTRVDFDLDGTPQTSVFSLTGVCVDEENGVQVAQRGQGEAQEVLVRYAEVRTLEERKRAQRFLVVSHNSVLDFRFGGLKSASKSILDLILRLASLVSIPAPIVHVRGGFAGNDTARGFFFFCLFPRQNGYK